MIGFTRAGLAGTTEGEQLGLQMQLLSREIAAIALPAVRALTDALGQLTGWFRSLSGEQQAQISRVVSLGAAFLAASLVLPKLVIGLKAVGGAMALLTANPLIAVVSALTAILVGSEEGRGALGRIFDALKPALSALGDVFGAIWSLLQPVIEALGEILPPLIEALVPAFEAVASVIRTIVGWIKKAVEGVVWLLEQVGAISEEQANAARAFLAGERRQDQRQGGRQRESVTAQGRGPADVRSFFSAFQNAALRQDSARVPERQLSALQQIEQNTRPPGRPPQPPPPPVA